MVIQWTPSLSVGVPEIDAQHQELFRRAERLIVALRAGDREEVRPLVTYLAEYVVSHFEDEEREMRATAYPDFAHHKAAHDKFRADFLEMAREFDRKGATALVALTLHNWLSDWLRRHVGGADLDLGRFLQRQARGA
jgi:hemerythrin